MSENLKTIKELADELGIAKQTIQYHLKFLPTENRQKNNSGSIVLNLEEQRFIKKRLTKIKKGKSTESRQKNDKKPTKNNEELSVNSLLLEQIKDLKNNRDKQLENKDKQLLQMQNLLDQQQRLALQDKKLLEEYKAENDNLKALKMPSEDTKEEQVDNQSLEKEKDFVQSIQESYESEIKALNQKLAEQEEQLQEIQNEKEMTTKKWWKFWQ